MFAILPSAGLSARMGRPKLLLPLGSRSILESVIVALRDGGVDRVLVVVGPHVPELVPLAKAVGAMPLLLSEATPDMRATLEHGFSWIEREWRPSATDQWLLIPADHPVVDPRVIRVVREYPASGVVIPTYLGKRGHPIRLDWSMVDAIRELPQDAGVNRLLRAYPEIVHEVPVDSDTILLDLDTPADYEALVRRFADDGKLW